MLGFFCFWKHCEFLLQWILGGYLWSQVCRIFYVCLNTYDILTYELLNTCRFVFGLTALLPLITSAVAVLVKEQPVYGSIRGQNISSDSNTGFLASSKSSIMQLWVTVKQPNVFLPTLFIFLWQATPHSDSAMFYFTYVDSSTLRS